jgi:mono/diheme cytochrome c family protein
MSVSAHGWVVVGTVMSVVACSQLSCGERTSIDEHPADADAPSAPVAPAEPHEAGASSGQETPSADSLMTQGRALYNAHCLICHQADGAGMPNFQPSLIDSEVVANDPDRLLRMVLYGVGAGPNALALSGNYSGAMNAFGHLPDEDLAALLSFVRMEWGGAEEPVTVSDIERVRAASAE